MTIGANVYIYPCNRGNPTGLDRGYHRYEVAGDGVVCVLCGKQPDLAPSQPAGPAHGKSGWQL